MSNQIKTEGFVLKKKALLNKDVLVTFFTKEMGKVVSIAKGARKLTSSRSAHIQTGNYIQLQLHKSHEMYYLQRTTLISAFSNIRTEEKQNVLYLYLYILNAVVPELVTEPSIYSLTKKFFVDLALETDREKYQSILESLLNKMLKQLGYIDSRKNLRELIQTIEHNIEVRLPNHVII